MKNESHEPDDEDNEQTLGNLINSDMMPRNDGMMYTNCHAQKSLMVGDMHWID